jgi:hypothetical protein
MALAYDYGSSSQPVRRAPRCLQATNPRTGRSPTMRRSRSRFQPSALMRACPEFATLSPPVCCASWVATKMTPVHSKLASVATKLWAPRSIVPITTALPSLPDASANTSLYELIPLHTKSVSLGTTGTSEKNAFPQTQGAIAAGQGLLTGIPTPVPRRRRQVG